MARWATATGEQSGGCRNAQGAGTWIRCAYNLHEYKPNGTRNTVTWDEYRYDAKYDSWQLHGPCRDLRHVTEGTITMLNNPTTKAPARNTAKNSVKTKLRRERVSSAAFWERASTSTTSRWPSPPGPVDRHTHVATPPATASSAGSSAAVAIR